jgi:exportin-1
MNEAKNEADTEKVLTKPDNIKLISNVLKTNVSACSSIGSFFYPQLARIFLDILSLYREVSNIINNDIAAPGEFAIIKN